MDYIKGVMDLSSEFLKESRHVSVWHVKINEVALVIKEIQKNKKKDNHFGMPDIPLIKDEQQRIAQIILYELMAGAINYKYWYGKHDVRPNDSGATKMYKVLDDTFNEITEADYVTDAYTQVVIDRFIENLSSQRFPMYRERRNHLIELIGCDIDLFINPQHIGDSINIYAHGHKVKAADFVRDMAASIDNNDDNYNIEYWLEKLIVSFPGYAQDMFLKRAFLFFMMLNRRMGWFEKDIHKLLIPADYQVPKMLNWMGAIDYSLKLTNDIYDSKLIPKGSLEECEIRAATIIACKLIAEEAGVTMCDVDDYLWCNRKECDDPFHLTITTDY